MLASKVTDKYQATIPRDIRELLHIGKGDKVAFEIVQNKVVLKKVKRADHEYLESLSGLLTEWDSYEDDEAYSDL
jgi:antitoxin PrlF